MLLIGTYTRALPHMRGRGTGISGATLSDGTIGAVSLRVATPNPSYLAVSSDGAFVYAVDEVGATLSAFTGNFAPLGTVPTNGAAPCHVTLSPDERFVLVSHWGSGSVSVHERRSDGSLGVRDIIVSPDSEHLLVANQDSNNIAVFAIEPRGLRYVSSADAPTPVCLVVAP